MHPYTKNISNSAKLVPFVFFSSIIVTLALESMDTEAKALNTQVTTMTTSKHGIRWQISNSRKTFMHRVQTLNQGRMLKQLLCQGEPFLSLSESAYLLNLQLQCLLKVFHCMSTHQNRRNKFL